MRVFSAANHDPPARLRVLNARDDLDQGRLAGSVLANKAMHLARVEGEIDTVESLNAAEPLRDVREFQKMRHIDLATQGETGSGTAPRASGAVRFRAPAR